MESSLNASVPSPNKVIFGEFELNLSTGELQRHSVALKLQHQPSLVLRLLVAHQGEIVSRAEIQRQVWGEDTLVDCEQGLNWCIRQIREVLGDDASNPRFIRTIAKAGYKFTNPSSSGTSASTQSKSLKTKLLVSIRPVALAVASLIVIAVVTFVWVVKHAAFPISHSTTLLVLPLDNFTGDQRNEFVADAATDELIVRLGKINPQRLRVIDRVTAAKFKRSKECIIHIGQQLHADYVLVGSIVPAKEGFRVTSGVFRVTDNTQVWSGLHDGLPAAGSDAYAVISENVADVLSLEAKR